MFKKIILATIFTSFCFSNNYSLSFDGVDDYVTLGSNSSFDIIDELTISATIKGNDFNCASIVDRLPGTNDSSGYRLNLRGYCANVGEVWSQIGNASAGDVATSDGNGYIIGEWVTITGVYKNSGYTKLYTSNWEF